MSTPHDPTHPATTAATRLEHGVRRGGAFRFTCDGQEVRAHPGETVGAALLAAGVSALRYSERQGEPRGMFCGMGLCFECRVTIDGRPNQRACITPAAPGMQVTRQQRRD